jgi:pSer/pThr/pTyr-binding forkhead associated (FHA) protein
MPYLVVHSPNSKPIKTKLSDHSVMGRAMGCELWLDDPKLSRRHFAIERDGERWMLTDLDSSNGTYVNGRRMDTIELRDGMMIEAGNAKVIFCDGDFVAHRPADPIEAASWGPGLLQRESLAEDSTVAGRVLPEPQPIPFAPTPAPIGPDGLTNSFTSTRPRPKPIVDSTSGSRWFNGLMSQLLRNS